MTDARLKRFKVHAASGPASLQVPAAVAAGGLLWVFPLWVVVSARGAKSNTSWSVMDQLFEA